MPKKLPGKKPLQVRISQENAAYIQKICEAEVRPAANVVNLILKEVLPQHWAVSQKPIEK